ncbi:MAG: hypothetical protein JKY01_05310 [Pseudomonadales bacterium]|nr:hypothetical protein [Pseudomonadales bacterium]
MPTKRERMLSKLRIKAIHDGISVKIVWLKELDWITGGSVPSQFTAYQHIGGEPSHHVWHCVPVGDETTAWQIEGNLDSGDIMRIRALKKALADHLVAIERQPSALIVYWQESEDLYSDVYRYLFTSD